MEHVKDIQIEVVKNGILLTNLSSDDFSTLIEGDDLKIRCRANSLSNISRLHWKYDNSKTIISKCDEMRNNTICHTG